MTLDKYALFLKVTGSTISEGKTGIYWRRCFVSMPTYNILFAGFEAIALFFLDASIGKESFYLRKQKTEIALADLNSCNS